MNQQTVELNVSRKGMIASMRDSFTSGHTFIKELMQNARRAGASGVWLSFDRDQRALTISDDGVGIKNPQTLLQLGESGWESIEVMEQENPFGVGFAAAIFAADELRIASHNWVIDTSTEALLDMRPVDIAPATEPVDGTTITLALKADVFEDLSEPIEALIKEFARGFAIPVYLNDQPMERPHALDNVHASACEAGMLVPVLTNNELTDKDYKCYYQGFPVGRLSVGRGLLFSRLRATFGWGGKDVGVIHLDTTRFRARMPDRDCLINEEQAREEINDALKDYLTDYLHERERSLDPEAFVRAHARDALALEPRLLADKPLPPGLYAYITSLPRENEFMDFLNEGMRSDSDPLINQTTPLIAEIDFEEWFEYAMFDKAAGHNAVLAYATELGWPMLRQQKTLEWAGHWAVDKAIDLSALAESGGMDVSLENAQSDRLFSGRYVYTRLIFCDHYTVTPSDERLPTLTIADKPFLQGANMVIPKGAEWIDFEATLLQISNYYDENEAFDEDALAEDVRQVARLHRLAFAGDHAGFFAETIRSSVRAVWDELAGREFVVSVSDEGELEVIEK